MTGTSRRVPARRPRLTAALAVVAAALALQALGANPAVSQARSLSAFRASENPGLDPAAGTWSDAPPVEMPLTAQQVTWPFGGSIPMLEVRALHNEGVLYIRMSWEDDTHDAETGHVDQFIDAAAVEFPARAASSVPAICMGQSDGGVNIWQWRAGSRDGLPDTIEDLSRTGYVDLYPSTEGLFFPAREVGNPVAEPRPVQDLVAVGFGSLTPAVDQDVRGMAEWRDGRWTVVFARELSHHAAEQVDLGEGASTDIAFAVWNGSEGERDGIKSVSQFVVLDIVSGGSPRSTGAWILIMLATVAGVALFVVVLGAAIDRSVNREAGRAGRDPAPEQA